MGEWGKEGKEEKEEKRKETRNNSRCFSQRSFSSLSCPSSGTSIFLLSDWWIVFGLFLKTSFRSERDRFHPLTSWEIISTAFRKKVIHLKIRNLKNCLSYHTFSYGIQLRILCLIITKRLGPPIFSSKASDLSVGSFTTSIFGALVVGWRALTRTCSVPKVDSDRYRGRKLRLWRKEDY